MKKSENSTTWEKKNPGHKGMWQKMGRIIWKSSPWWAKTGYVVNGEQEIGRFISATEPCLEGIKDHKIKDLHKALSET